MTLDSAQRQRLEFLCRVTQKEIKHLLDTDRRLFADLFTIEMAKNVEADPVLAERLDAFVSRFGQLQDNLADKLLPQLLIALAEKPGPAITTSTWPSVGDGFNLPRPGCSCVNCATKWFTNTSKTLGYSPAPCKQATHMCRIWCMPQSKWSRKLKRY